MTQGVKMEASGVFGVRDVIGYSRRVDCCHTVLGDNLSKIEEVRITKFVQVT